LKKYHPLFIIKDKYFWLSLDSKLFIRYRKEFKIVEINSLWRFKIHHNYVLFLHLFIFSWISLVTKKIKFKHKGAWISLLNKKIRLLVLNFRLAHLTVMVNQRVMLRRRKKHFSFHTLLCLGYNFKVMFKLCQTMYNYFKLNKFTFRGIRLSRQRLIKKEGKISKYMIDLKK
jgi:hypothetical protein